MSQVLSVKPAKFTDDAAFCITKELSEWITTSQLGTIAGIDRRNATAAATRCLNGKEWQGTVMTVRAEGRRLMVYAPSLPEKLRNIWHKSYTEATRVKSPSPVTLPSPKTYNEKAVVGYRWQQWRLGVIAPALMMPKYSEERGSALRAIVRRELIKPNGKTCRLSMATLQAWVQKYEAAGERSLAPKARDESAPRVLINRRWDRESPFPSDEKAEIAGELLVHVQSLWAGGAPGWPRVNQLGSVKLLHRCLEAGWKEATLEICQLGRPFVEKAREYSLVAIQEGNAKLFVDKFAPRIHRTRKGYKPGDIVIGDVHPLDVQRLVDGRIVHARLIAWLDLATYDLFVTVLILPPGRGIRQEDVAASFVDMVQAWGLPKQLRIDNGQEFNWKDMIAGLENLAALVAAFTDFRASLMGEGEAGEMIDSVQFRPRMAVSKATPYNAAAKQIEGVFGIIEQFFLSMMPGWIAGDRMNKRTHKVGEAPRPYIGDDKAFERDFEICLDLYRNTPQADGSSPNDKRRAAYDAGFKPVTISRHDLIFAFSEVRKFTVQTGGINVYDQWYQADILIPLVTKRVDIRVAKWDRSQVFYVDQEGKLHAIPKAREFLQDDPAGAKEKGKGIALINRHCRQLKSGTHPVNLLAEAAAVNDALPRPPTLPAGIQISTEEGGAIASAIDRASAPIVLKRLPGQIQDPGSGSLLSLVDPPNGKGSKPTAIDFDPLSFSPPATEEKDQTIDSPEFDLLQILADRHGTNGKDAI